MNKIKLGESGRPVSEIALGCMRLNSLSRREAEHLLRTAMEYGINFFDHADIYGGGSCESLFGEALTLNQDQREKICIQTKCGIADGYYDLSEKHIVESVEKSLGRLRTDYIDILLLHRPDELMEPEEVAEAFSMLQRSGKVRSFGVCNQNSNQIRLLQKYLGQKIIVDQLQFGVMHTGLIDSGISVNTDAPQAADRDGGVLSYCRLHGISVQAWSPLQYGTFRGVFLNNPNFPDVNRVIDRSAEVYHVTNSALAIAWILRHPAKIQVIVGTTNENHLKEILKASGVRLTRQEWYEIYRAAGNPIP